MRALAILHRCVLCETVNDRFGYDVVAGFDRFERTMSDDSVLGPCWTVRDGVTRTALIRHRTHLNASARDHGCSSLVAAMNGNLTALSHDTASAIAKRPCKGGNRAGA